MRGRVLGGLAFSLLFLLPVSASGQAWLPPAGEGAIAVLYQNSLVRDHLGPDGKRIPAGEIQTHALLLDFTYGISSKVAFNLNIPFIASRYTGPRPHPKSELDNASYHGTFQDFRANVRYALATGSTVITPFVDVIVPSHHYDYWGHAGPGRRLAEVQVGTYVARVITRLRGTFVQGRYSYGFTQRPLHMYHDRSIADAEVGKFIHPRLRVFGLVASQYTHGGLDLTTTLMTPASTGPQNPAFQHHDQLARASILDAGGGAQFDLKKRMTLFGSFATTLAGQNAHALDRGLTVGVSWGFGSPVHSGPLLTADTKRALPRCLCQKGETAR